MGSSGYTTSLLGQSGLSCSHLRAHGRVFEAHSSRGIRIVPAEVPPMLERNMRGRMKGISVIRTLFGRMIECKKLLYGVTVLRDSDQSDKQVDERKSYDGSSNNFYEL